MLQNQNLQTNINAPISFFSLTLLTCGADRCVIQHSLPAWRLSKHCYTDKEESVSAKTCLVSDEQYMVSSESYIPIKYYFFETFPVKSYKLSNSYIF